MYIQNCLRSVNGNEITLTGKCIVTGEKYSVTVKKDQLERYMAGELAQKAFPFLSADDREFLISGTSPEGWNRLFPDADVNKK